MTDHADIGRLHTMLKSEYDALVAERDEAKKAWWDQRNEWAVATGRNMDIMAALEDRAEAAEARVAQLETAIDKADAFLADPDGEPIASINLARAALGKDAG